MKNIYLIPTDKPSRLWTNNLLQGKLELSKKILIGSNTAKHIYITSDEEIKREDCILLPNNEIIVLPTGLSQVPLNNFTRGYSLSNCKKIILTTDLDLIKDGVQPIDDEFLEWFVKNPSCEFAHLGFTSIIGDLETKRTYKIIIPKEEPKQETIEEAAERYSSNVLSKLGFLNGVKWQQERSYSEEEIYNLIQAGYSFCEKGKNREDVKKWFEQFKKK